MCVCMYVCVYLGEKHVYENRTVARTGSVFGARKRRVNPLSTSDPGGGGRGTYGMDCMPMASRGSVKMKKSHYQVRMARRCGQEVWLL